MMVNISSSKFTNVATNLTKMSNEAETQNDLYEVNCIITIIFNCLACPLTVLFNVLVIMAVKRRPRLQSKTNILLACLAATDVWTGLTVQPSFVMWKTLEILRISTESEIFSKLFHRCSIRAVCVCSALHLMLVTCERLIAIKFTMHYPNLVIKRNIKVAVTAVWIFSLFCGASWALDKDVILTFSNFFLLFIYLSCILFILCSYLILYRETLRHQKMIKTQQLSQEEVDRITKESRALKTAVFIVGAVVLCFVPSVFFLVLWILGVYHSSVSFFVFEPLIRTFAMLNSLLNPLIYCWRQSEMRKFVFRFPIQAVHPLTEKHEKN